MPSAHTRPSGRPIHVMTHRSADSEAVLVQPLSLTTVAKQPESRQVDEIVQTLVPEPDCARYRPSRPGSARAIVIAGTPINAPTTTRASGRRRTPRRQVARRCARQPARKKAAESVYITAPAPSRPCGRCQHGLPGRWWRVSSKVGLRVDLPVGADVCAIGWVVVAERKGCGS